MSERYVLGPMQAGMFFQSLLSSDQASDDTGFDIEQLSLQFKEPLDQEAMRNAWSLVAARHPILSTSFHLDGSSEPGQIVHQGVVVPLEVADWSRYNDDEAQRRRRYEDFLRADRARGFALDTPPLLRVTLIQRGDGTTELVWTFHHIILDGRSFALVLKDVMLAYAALVRGAPVELDPAPRPYRDYIEWLGTLDLDNSRNFFRQLLAGKSTPTPLPCAEPVTRPLSARGYGEWVQRVPPQTVASMHALASSSQTTLGTVVNAAWAVVLGRFTGDEDVIFGSTRACRRSALGGDAQDMVGLFINTLPLRARLGEGRSVADLLQNLRAQVVALRDHEHTPLAEIQAVSELPRGTALFQSLVMFETQELGQMLRASGIPLLADCSPHLHEQPSLPLNVTVFDGEHFEIRMLYDRKRFREPVVRRLAESMSVALGELAVDVGRPVHEVEVLPDAEKQRVVFEWNATERPFGDHVCIHEGFEAQVARQPDAVAAEMNGETLSYRELERRANRLAHALRARGARPGVYVGICLTRGLSLVVALLGVAKSGAAYVPLDPQYPEDRLAFMLADTEAILVVTEQQHSGLFEAPKLVLDGDDAQDVEGMPAERPARLSGPGDVCYAIFTSGSTGIPKGVVLTHRAVVNTFEWVSRTFEVGPGDRLLFVTSPCFDLSVYDTFGALAAGATVVVASEERLKDPQALADSIVSEKITIWDSAPAALQRLVSFFPKHAPEAGLRLVMLSGDWIPVALPDQIRQVFARAKVMSLGGATEAAIWSNWYPIGVVDPEWTSIPYGKPIQNARYHVLDTNLNVAPVGVSGDLYIGGVCLAEGYLRRPELTRERFIADPFRPGERLYKTGDLARYFEDGNLEFLGRADFQVKIRGYRVEMGEVEAVTANLEGVREAVCTAFVDASGQKSLVVYVIVEQGASLDAAAIKAGVAAKLPDFMVPSYVVFLEKMPLSANGKVDRKALPSPTATTDQQAYVAPRNSLEQKVAEAWEELLGRKPIGIRDNFFELGGHSLLAVMLVSRLKASLGLEFPLAYIMEEPTIEALAERLRGPSSVPGAMKHLVPLNQSGSLPPLFLCAGAGGYGFMYQQLSSLLGPSQPVYVLQAVGSRRESDIGNYSIEQIAEIYEREILPVSGSGPIVFAGYSFGALAAFELAKRFRDKGCSIACLISFDGFAPRFPRLLPIHKRVVSHLNALKHADMAGRREYMARRWSNVKRRGLKLLGRDRTDTKIDSADAKLNTHISRLEASLWTAQRSYDPPYTLNCPLLLFKCENPEQWVGSEMDDPLYGWETCINGPISTVTLPGDHLNLFEGDNPKLMAEAIARQLRMGTLQRETA